MSLPLLQAKYLLLKAAALREAALISGRNPQITDEWLMEIPSVEKDQLIKVYQILNGCRKGSPEYNRVCQRIVEILERIDNKFPCQPGALVPQGQGGQGGQGGTGGQTAPASSDIINLNNIKTLQNVDTKRSLIDKKEKEIRFNTYKALMKIKYGIQTEIVNKLPDEPDLFTNLKLVFVIDEKEFTGLKTIDIKLKQFLTNKDEIIRVLSPFIKLILDPDTFRSLLTDIDVVKDSELPMFIKTLQNIEKSQNEYNKIIFEQAQEEKKEKETYKPPETKYNLEEIINLRSQQTIVKELFVNNHTKEGDEPDSWLKQNYSFYTKRLLEKSFYEKFPDTIPFMYKFQITPNGAVLDELRARLSNDTNFSNWLTKLLPTEYTVKGQEFYTTSMIEEFVKRMRERKVLLFKTSEILSFFRPPPAFPNYSKIKSLEEEFLNFREYLFTILNPKKQSTPLAFYEYKPAFWESSGTLETFIETQTLNKYTEFIDKYNKVKRSKPFDESAFHAIWESYITPISNFLPKPVITKEGKQELKDFLLKAIQSKDVQKIASAEADVINFPKVFKLATESLKKSYKTIVDAQQKKEEALVENTKFEKLDTKGITNLLNSWVDRYGKTDIGVANIIKSGKKFHDLKFSETEQITIANTLVFKSRALRQFYKNTKALDRSQYLILKDDKTEEWQKENLAIWKKQLLLPSEEYKKDTVNFPLVEKGSEDLLLFRPLLSSGAPTFSMNFEPENDDETPLQKIRASQGLFPTYICLEREKLQQLSQHHPNEDDLEKFKKTHPKYFELYKSSFSTFSSLPGDELLMEPNQILLTKEDKEKNIITFQYIFDKEEEFPCDLLMLQLKYLMTKLDQGFTSRLLHAKEKILADEAKAAELSRAGKEGDEAGDEAGGAKVGGNSGQSTLNRKIAAIEKKREAVQKSGDQTQMNLSHVMAGALAGKQGEKPAAEPGASPFSVKLKHVGKQNLRRTVGLRRAPLTLRYRTTRKKE